MLYLFQSSFGFKMDPFNTLGFEMDQFIIESFQGKFPK